MENELRFDGRRCDELRPISFETGIAPNAAGSVLAIFGNTKVICAACLEKKIPSWMNGLEPQKGWMTAEYSMLPYSTLTRKPRPSSGKTDGRSVEIQRLIGRSLRAVADLSKIPGYSLLIDCDVLQADGGTRTASISGAYVAAKIAVSKFIASREISADPFLDSVAAVSAGLLDGKKLLDLPYQEDCAADVDANIVMTGSGKLVEIQCGGEESVFEESDLLALLNLARGGIEKIRILQERAIESALKK